MEHEPPVRDCFTVAFESGRVGFLVFYGVLGTALTPAFVDGWWIVLVLVTGALVGSLMAWRMYGFSHLWLEGDVVVEQTPTISKRIPLSGIREVRLSYFPVEDSRSGRSRGASSSTASRNCPDAVVSSARWWP
jgi:hypothetical protein